MKEILDIPYTVFGGEHCFDHNDPTVEAVVNRFLDCHLPIERKN